ncbi:hypothetical protein AB9M75_02645 [Lactobacillus sp. AN1001]
MKKYIFITGFVAVLLIDYLYIDQMDLFTFLILVILIPEFIFAELVVIFGEKLVGKNWFDLLMSAIVNCLLALGVYFIVGDEIMLKITQNTLSLIQNWNGLKVTNVVKSEQNFSMLIVVFILEFLLIKFLGKKVVKNNDPSKSGEPI